MRLRPFLPLILLVSMLTSCQTDYHGDDLQAIDSKSLKIKDAKTYFEKHRPTMTRTQGDVMTLGISERCSPDWSQAKESENEFLYCVEVPLTSGFKFVSMRKRKLGGKEISLSQDLFRKLVVLKNKETDEIFMGVMSLIPKVYFTNGEPSTSYDFNHFGDKCGYSGLVIYTDPVGTLVTTDFYLKGERVLHHHLSKENPRMDIVRKIIGPVKIFAFDIATRNGGDDLTWYCPICEMDHHYDDMLPGDCFNVTVDICQGCLSEVAYCTCSYNNACWNCGQMECNCADYLTCSECGRLYECCICGSCCPDCGDLVCDDDHNAENESEQNPNNPLDPVQAGRNRISCTDADVNTILDNLMNNILGRIAYSKIDIAVPVLLNQSHKGAQTNIWSDELCWISIGNEDLSADMIYSILEELLHIAQLCEYGYDIFRSAKLNFEFEAKIIILQEICGTDDGVYNQHLDETGMFSHSLHALAQHYFLVGYGELGDQSFDERYQESVDGIRNTDSDYANEDMYPENPNHRNFNTFHEDYQNSK